jgi:hypothetical protein
MAGDDGLSALFGAPVGHEFIPGLARGILDTALRLGTTPFQGRVIEAKRARPFAHLRGLVSGFGPKSMIDGEDAQPWRARLALTPGAGKQHQGNGIRSAGYGKSEMIVIQQRSKKLIRGNRVDRNRCCLSTRHAAFP